MPRLFTMLILACCVSCKQQHDGDLTKAIECDEPAGMASNSHSTRGALLATRFKSLSELKSVIQIEYYHQGTWSDSAGHGSSRVRLTHCSNGRKVVSILATGTSESDFNRAKSGGVGERLWLSISSPYTLMNRRDLQRVSLLARRNYHLFDAGDVAFFDLAEATVESISDWDSVFVNPEDLTEKGYLNTFNHITAQAFMTSMFSEGIADFMADAHERNTMPELITGTFTPEQLTDSINNPVDNYVDMINNELGQDLGKKLRVKYGISAETHWTPESLADYLNDLQSYYGWALQIGFEPYRPEDDDVIRFANKINAVWRLQPE